MMPTFAAVRLTALGLVAATLIGCGGSRDAAAEDPVDVLPGYYTISLDGEYRGFAIPDQSAGEEADGTYCVMEGQQADFARRVATGLAVHPGCTEQPLERTGNQVTGGWRCPTDPQRAPGGAWNIAYTGVISREAVEITGTMDIDMPDNLPGMTAEQRQQLAAGEAMMESIDITVTARRTGDCG